MAYLGGVLVMGGVVTLVVVLLGAALVWVARRSPSLGSALLWGAVALTGVATVGMVILAKMTV